jgi:phosphoribosylaminoimidazole carboxylase PurE protein
MSSENQPIVGIIMGSDSDLDIMGKAAETLESFGVAHEVRIISAHRSPDIMAQYAAEAVQRGLKVIIAGAGGSAHLPGMTASHTRIPVIAVPIKRAETDHEALWSNIKMPPGIPLATLPENGALNAALLAIEILALYDPELAKAYEAFRLKQLNSVIEKDSAVSSDWRSQLNH